MCSSDLEGGTGEVRLEELGGRAPHLLLHPALHEEVHDATARVLHDERREEVHALAGAGEEVAAHA